MRCIIQKDLKEASSGYLCSLLRVENPVTFNLKENHYKILIIIFFLIRRSIKKDGGGNKTDKAKMARMRRLNPIAI